MYDIAKVANSTSHVLGNTGHAVLKVLIQWSNIKLERFCIYLALLLYNTMQQY